MTELSNGDIKAEFGTSLFRKYYRIQKKLKKQKDEFPFKYFLPGV
jgi:hypothetical protein